MERVRVKCPRCGQLAPVEFAPSDAESKGVFIKCKGRHCGRVFEVKIKDGRQADALEHETKKL